MESRNYQNVMEKMKQEILSANMPEAEKTRLLQNFLQLKNQKVNLLITGATGCGKSSTINALFETQVARVGVGVDPETMDITHYDLENLILWDCPGLGDGKTADERHARNIIRKLNETDNNGNRLIDLVLVILDGSSRDLGTSYDLINRVIVPNLGSEANKRLLVAINKADAAMSGRNWDFATSQPNAILAARLKEQAASVKSRIKAASGLEIETICYSAGYTENGMQEKPYNLSVLFYYILQSIPEKKQPILECNKNQKKENWESNESNAPAYRESTMEKISDGIYDALMAPAYFVEEHCYITTAVCEAYGKPDDCYELTSFRAFRDEWLRKQPDGPALIDEYYRTAPGVVRWINSQENRSEIYRYIKSAYLNPCLSYIESGDNQRCKETYTDMMHYLYRRQNQPQ